MFVTGRQEVNALKKRLNSTFPVKPVPKQEVEAADEQSGR